MGHPASPPAELPDEVRLIGRVIAERYQIEALLERTARGSVFRALRLDGRRSVLLRVFSARSGLSRELCRDALALAERAALLSSPHIARTLDVGMIAERWPVVVSEHSRGSTLAAWLGRHGPPRAGRALAIGQQLASALELAHLSRLVHGALHLDGVWVEAPGGRPEWVRLLDFGLAELPGADFEPDVSGVFASLESPARGGGPPRAAVQADVHALGAALAQLSGADRLRRLGTSSAEGALQRALSRVIDRCTGAPATPPYPSMAALRLDLESLAERARGLDEAEAAGAPVTVTHAPARRAGVTLGGPKVIVRDER